MKQIKYQPKEEIDLNDRLINLYGSKLVGLYTDFEPLFERKKGVTPALPLLLWINDYEAYEKADIKVMVFGRENNNWNDPTNRKGYPNDAYNFGLETSEDIQHEISGIHDDTHDIYGICDIYVGYQDKNEASQTPFTKRKHILVDMLKSALPDKNIEVVWNNIHKVCKGAPGNGECRGEPTAEIQEIVRNRFNVIPDEIEILKPDILIFLTGKQADKTINQTFNIDFNAFSQIKPDMFIHRVDIPGIKYAVRTIHPGFKSNEYFIKHLNTLIEDITKNFK